MQCLNLNLIPTKTARKATKKESQSYVAAKIVPINTTIRVSNYERVESYNLVDDEDPKTWSFVGFAAASVLLQFRNGCFPKKHHVLLYLSIHRGISLASASICISSLNLAALTAKIIGGNLGDKYDNFHVSASISALLLHWYCVSVRMKHLRRGEAVIQAQ